MPQPAPNPSAPPPDAIKTNRDLIATVVYDAARHEYQRFDEICAQYGRQAAARDRPGGVGLTIAITSIAGALLRALFEGAKDVAAESAQKEGAELTKSAFTRLRRRSRGPAQPADGPPKTAGTRPPLAEWLAQDVRSLTEDDAIRYRDAIYHAMLDEQLSPRRAADISQRAYELLLRFPAAAPEQPPQPPQPSTNSAERSADHLAADSSANGDGAADTDAEHSNHGADNTPSHHGTDSEAP